MDGILKTIFIFRGLRMYKSIKILRLIFLDDTVLSHVYGHFNLGLYDADKDECMMWSQDVVGRGPEDMITERLNRKHCTLC
jgi:hypothetical protein